MNSTGKFWYRNCPFVAGQLNVLAKSLAQHSLAVYIWLWKLWGFFYKQLKIATQSDSSQFFLFIGDTCVTEHNVVFQLFTSLVCNTQVLGRLKNPSWTLSIILLSSRLQILLFSDLIIGGIWQHWHRYRNQCYCQTGSVQLGGVGLQYFCYQQYPCDQ